MNLLSDFIVFVHFLLHCFYLIIIYRMYYRVALRALIAWLHLLYSLL